MMTPDEVDLWEDLVIAAVQGRLAGEARRTEVTTSIDYLQFAADVCNIADAVAAEMKARNK